MSLQQQLVEQLSALYPDHLEVINESVHHGGYFVGKESHFKVIVVSDVFDGLSRVQKHQCLFSNSKFTGSIRWANSCFSNSCLQ